MDNGCDTLRQLWGTAVVDLAIDKPGVTGVIPRGLSFVESGNMRWSMQLAALKCWEERTRGLPTLAVSLPPIVNEDAKYVSSSTSSSSSPSGGQWTSQSSANSSTSRK